MVIVIIHGSETSKAVLTDMRQGFQMSSLQCKELTDVKQFFKRLRTVVVLCSKTKFNKTSLLISVKKIYVFWLSRMFQCSALCFDMLKKVLVSHAITVMIMTCLHLIKVLIVLYTLNIYIYQ